MNRRQFALAGVAAGSLAGCSTPGLKLDVPCFTVATMDHTAYLWVVPPR